MSQKYFVSKVFNLNCTYKLFFTFFYDVICNDSLSTQYQQCLPKYQLRIRGHGHRMKSRLKIVCLLRLQTFEVHFDKYVNSRPCMQYVPFSLQYIEWTVIPQLLFSTFYSFLFGLDSSNQVFGAFCSAKADHKLVSTSSAKQTTGAKSLLS